MLKQLQNWFIGAYLRRTSDIVEQCRIVLLYHVLLISLVFLFFLIPIMLTSGQYIQLVRISIIIISFLLAIFSIHQFQSIKLASHIVIAISTFNLFFMIYYLYQQVDGVSYMLSIANIIFAFYFLRWRWVIFYILSNMLAVIVFVLLSEFRLYHIPVVPQSLHFDDFFLCMILLFLLIGTGLSHCRIAFSQSSSKLRKSLEEQKQLSQQYLLMNEQLQLAKEKADQVNRMKTNFLSNMSHEIRTPLNGILGIAQIIDEETENKDIREYVSLQKKSGQRLLDTITSILYLARLEAEKPEIQLNKIEINELVAACYDSLQALAIQKKLHYRFLPYIAPLTCWAEAPILHHVLSNLISNAIKFTSEGEITITTGIRHDQPDLLFISIRDTGIGIAGDFLPHLFQPFEQESSGQNRRFEGNGLGLSIASKYVELLGGSIMVESEKDMGSTFTILLPVN